MIDEKQAVAMIDPRTLDTLLHPQFDGEVLKKTPVIGSALAASPGAACGKVVFSAEDAKAWAERGEKVVLVRLETSPEDIEGMKAAQGIPDCAGGMTSHAAVVARGMGTCCVSGCGAIKMDEENKQFELSGKTFHERRLAVHRRLHRQASTTSAIPRWTPLSAASSAGSWAGPTSTAA
ncbi:MAG: PEP-utilizing enzyme [Oscillibacter sp.]